LVLIAAAKWLLTSMAASPQAVEVIASFKANHVYGEPIVTLAANLHRRLSDPENLGLVMQALSSAEGRAFERFAGPLAFSFTLHNPTGHYVLDLGKKAERDVAVMLASWKNKEDALEEQAYRDQPQFGMPRVGFERVWRNATINGRRHAFSTTAVIPFSGRFEVDFVQISRPDPEARAVRDAELDALIHAQWRLKDKEDPESLVRYFRELSNLHLFTCSQVQSVLLLLTKAVHMGGNNSDQKVMRRWASGALSRAFALWRFENRSPRRFVRLICLGDDSLAQSECLHRLRVEVVVTAFARLVDWHGLRPMILDHLSEAEREDVERRLGKYNLFDKATAVGAYSLDLACPDHHRVMQVGLERLLSG
jgi:hypothetical protein